MSLSIISPNFYFVVASTAVFSFGFSIARTFLHGFLLLPKLVSYMVILIISKAVLFL